MRTAYQIVGVTSCFLRSIPQRLGPTLVIVLGTAGVVGVLICVLALANGFDQAATKTGRQDRAVILASGANTEAASNLARGSVIEIANAPGVKRSPLGTPIFSAESLASLVLPDKRTGLDAFVTLRGIGPEAFELRPEVKLVEGRLFRAGAYELIVGRTAQGRLKGLEIGTQISLPKGDWVVVGIFDSGGDTHESELLTDAETMVSAYERNWFNSATVMLESAAQFQVFKDALTSVPSLSIDARRESDYFMESSKQVGNILTGIGYFIGGVMSLGAIFAALNTMYSAVSARSTEIATLRAIGFSELTVIAAVIIEAVLLCLVGAVIGAAITWLCFNGGTVSVMSGVGPVPTTYALDVNLRIISAGMVSALVVGTIGGMFPAIRAARLPIVTVMRDL